MEQGEERVLGPQDFCYVLASSHDASRSTAALFINSGGSSGDATGSHVSGIQTKKIGTGKGTDGEEEIQNQKLSFGR